MGHLRRPGCYNQPRPTDKSGYYALTREYLPTGEYYLKNQWIPFVMSKECMNDFRHPYPECEGCQHERREAE